MRPRQEEWFRKAQEGAGATEQTRKREVFRGFKNKMELRARRLTRERDSHVPLCNVGSGTQTSPSCRREEEVSRVAARPSLAGGRPNTSREDEPQGAAGEILDAQDILLEALRTTSSITPSLTIQGSVLGHSVGMLLDSGASANLMHPALASKLGVRLGKVPWPITVILADGSRRSVIKSSQDWTYESRIKLRERPQTQSCSSSWQTCQAANTTSSWACHS